MRHVLAHGERARGGCFHLHRHSRCAGDTGGGQQACQPGVNVSAVARQIGILPSQLYRWRRELLGSDEPGQAAETTDSQSFVSGPDPIVEIVIGNIVVRAGRHADEAHLQRVTRAVRSA
ncbi:transposase [Rhizobium leguminosarum]|uniref:Transposase n=1 Tax=Rhizobium leguminosarum TaxID=384 RepID=A0A6P0C5F9_RHILE|nr:transposase [Rhizobium leguminosarum]NEK54743.1 transposase [Rhizobium leguminosarum]